ncbi:MAG TPA: hypothetical protein VE944_19335 [Nostoc sp.]|uniref:hypothetical protein n=1 Tax=Nostoc sp. TaxID=1180 RepID=UPI002D327B2B|nr:hypothetical protein [Nostoc sp.]HYX16476.1 hypothetical protein [Nostoc sp.]
MANAPLDAFIGFGQVSFVDADKTWVALTANNKQTGEREKYNFTGENFTLQASAFTGVIDGDNHWLIAVLGTGSCNPKGGVFEFKVWKNGEGGNKGSFDKAAGDALGLQWQKDGCYAAIEVSSIPVMKTFVKVMSELKIICTNESKELLVRMNIAEADCPALEAAFSVFWAYLVANDGETPEEGTEAYSAALLINESGLMCLPAMSAEMLPNVPLKNVMGKITGHKVECFPFAGELPFIDGVSVVLPKKEEKKGGGRGSYSGGGSVDPKAALEARAKFYVSEMAKCDENITDIKGAYASIKANKEYHEYSELLLKIMGK